MYVLTLLHRSTLRAKYKAEDYLSNSYGGKKQVSTTSSHDTDTDTPTSPSSPPRVPKEDTPPPALSPPPTMRSAKEEEQAMEVLEDMRSFAAEAEKASDSKTFGEEMKGKEEKKVIWVGPDEEEGRRKPKHEASAVETQDLDNAEHKRASNPEQEPQMALGIFLIKILFLL